MKVIALSIMALLFASLNTAQTKENPLDNDEKIISVNTLERNALKPINENCPVENLKVNEEVPFIIFNNVLIGFCCEGCDEAFLKNPKAYEDKINRKDA
ncbi:MAG: hypothetical protein F9K42_01195 [Ignavibacterium sp.]|jgi:hypothetical protein|nr:MAG: hypothetical protein F9K42_01195 [Ignavibacterium sp.]MEB2297354.1 hypothetical protein [Ignavibacteria bacterium]